MCGDMKIGVIGGDLRQLMTACEFAADGFETAVFAFDKYAGSFCGTTRCVTVDDAIRGSDIIILPLPLTIDNIRLNCPLGTADIKLDELFSKFPPGQLIAGGRVTRSVYDIAEKAEVILIDYYEREELCVLNAVPTAEGALAIAINEMPTTIHGSNAVVLGYGRIGKVLARILREMGASVTVAARKFEDQAWIRVSGCDSVDITQLNKQDTPANQAITKADVIFNTVPATIIDKDTLPLIKEGALVIDLASKPGGIDFKAAKELSVNVIWALSLPGKTAPVTSGRIIKESVMNILADAGPTKAGAGKGKSNIINSSES